MFEDGIPAVEPDEEKRMRALDIAELLDASTRSEKEEVRPERVPEEATEGGEEAEANP
jgi:hypothetical protein